MSWIGLTSTHHLSFDEITLYLVDTKYTIDFDKVGKHLELDTQQTHRAEPMLMQY